MNREGGSLEGGEEMVNVFASVQAKSPLPASFATSHARTAAEEEERLRREREEAESIELARALMAEEAMASYEHHFMILRDDNDMSEEDRAVWQAAMREEEREHAAEALGSDDEANVSYEAMLQLGERIGDVKTERWAMVAQKEIDKLPTFLYDAPTAADTKKNAGAGSGRNHEMDASEVKCLVCQCEYEKGDLCCRLPCGHVFHKAGCADQWLLTRDFCPYCRRSIVRDQ
jgi:hypothetical protein